MKEKQNPLTAKSFVLIQAEIELARANEVLAAPGQTGLEVKSTN